MHTRTAARPLALLSALLLFSAVGLAACGDDSGDDASPSEGGGDEISVVAKDFSLTSVTAAPGEEVYFSNEGAKTHTMTSDDDAFDTGEVEPGEEAEFDAPSEPGTYAFHCSIHASMTGTLTVEG